MEKAHREILQQVPSSLLLEIGNVLEVTRLGGLTNQNYLVKGEREKVVVRCAGPGTGDYINRESEEHAAREASRLGVGAELLYFDPTTGFQMCGYLEGAVTMSAERFRKPGTVERAADCFRRLHENAKPFLTEFELFSMIDKYRSLLQSRAAELPDGFEETQTRSHEARRALASHPLPVAACHCDPLAENFLDFGDRMHLIDWEYCGNNDPMWDLADLSVEADFTAEQDERLLHAYFRGRAPAFESGRMVLYKALCDLLWALWGVIQQVDENPAQDFRLYASSRLARCRRLMSTPLYASALAAVSLGPKENSLS